MAINFSGCCHLLLKPSNVMANKKMTRIINVFMITKQILVKKSSMDISILEKSARVASPNLLCRNRLVNDCTSCYHGLLTDV